MTTSEAWPTTSTTPAAPAGSTSTRGMLRKLFSSAGLLGVDDDERRAPWRPTCRAARAAFFVAGSSNAAASRTAIVPRSAWTESAPRSARRRALRLTLTM